MNVAQKAGLFVAAAIFGVLLVLHSPWTGYEIPINENDYLGYVKYWRTNEPAVFWFGFVQNFLGVSVVLATLGGLWLFLCRSSLSTIPSVEQPADEREGRTARMDH